MDILSNIEIEQQKIRKVVDIMVNIELIEKSRKQHGYSKEKMSSLMGYEAKATYTKKSIGIRQFTIEDIVKICKLFNLELADLIIM